MRAIVRAQMEWEENTLLYEKDHFYKNGKRQGTDKFRKYGEAIALINWCEYIELTKLEKLPCTGKGASLQLINFLKSLADKYHVHLRGLVKPYIPDPPIPEGPMITDPKALAAWYRNHGFVLYRQNESAPTWIWYPDVAQAYLHHDPDQP